MDDATVITETDYQKYVICQKKLATEALVATLKLNSIANVLNLSRERHKYENTTAVEFVQHKKPSFSQNKVGRASLGTVSSPVNESDTPRTLRSFFRIFDKTMCIIPIHYSEC